MYIKPSLQRFGTFRELTKVGLSLTSDGYSILGAVGGDGRNPDPNFTEITPDQWERLLTDYPAQTTS